MLLLIICILFNAYISVIFKLFDRFKIKVLQAIVINYFVCVVTASIVLGKPAVTQDVVEQPWFLASLLIGLTFVVTFNLFAQTVQKFGVVLGSICQKMSLVAPTSLAIILFNDSAGILKIAGIIIAIISIFVISTSGKTKTKLQSPGTDSKTISPLIYALPIGTFIGSCFVDFGLWYVNEIDLASSLDIDFVATLFFFAGCFGIIFILFDYLKNKTTFRMKDIVAGFALGIPNFFSIWLLLKVLSNGMQASVVFPINNVGILVTTAILGLLFFKEKFNTQKIIGFMMAIAAIVLIAVG